MRITNLKPLISEEAIQTRVKEMAGEISTLYKDEPLVVVCVLKGAFMFFSDLVRHLTCKPELDFVRLASYGSAAQRSKTITFPSYLCGFIIILIHYVFSIRIF